MEQSFLIIILSAAVTAGTPLLFAALGELLTQKAGIMNLGLEGMMLCGAAAGFVITVRTGSLFWGVLFAMVAGGLLALLHAFLSISLKANQVVSGLALAIFGTGLSSFIGKSMIGIPAPVSFKKIKIPLLNEIPFLGQVLFNYDALVYLSFFLVAGVWFLIYKTKFGLTLRAVGENPGAADSLGVNVFLIRYLYVTIGGMLAGLGGAYLSLAFAPSWLENMTAGRGWIALALVIFSTWNPVRALLGAYIFGGIDALVYRMQAFSVVIIPSFFLKMMPYIFTVLVLIFATRETSRKRIGAPGALGLAYEREAR
ncbi:MAG: ABC transporter permease [Peptococcales bacterium]